METIGLVGAGVMGMCAARKIIDSGYSLLVFDIAPETHDEVRKLGASVFATAKEVAEKAQKIIMFLPGPKQVEEVVVGVDGLLAGCLPGTIILDMSTVDPGTTERLSQIAGKKEIGYLDAPVLGRPDMIGKWSLPIGGKKEDVETCLPLLKLFAAKLFHIGGPGSGNKVKLLNQLMFGAINAMTAEIMAIAKKMGLEPKVLYETISSSQAATVSNLFRDLGSRITSEDYSNPTFTVNLLAKDVHLAAEMARAVEAPPLLGATVELLNQIACAQGLGNRDTSMMWKSVQKIWEGV